MLAWQMTVERGLSGESVVNLDAGGSFVDPFGVLLWIHEKCLGTGYLFFRLAVL